MKLHHQDRTNDEWLEALMGIHGGQAQSDAFEDLGCFLIPYAISFLYNRRANNHPGLAGYNNAALEELAQDFVQDALIKLYRDDFRKLKTFNFKHERAKFTTWVKTVLINGIRDELRRSYWQNPIQNDVAGEEDEDNSISSSEKISDGLPGPEERVFLKAAMESMMECLESLSENTRIAFQKCVIDGFSIAELAELLGETNKNTIYSRIFRARAKLRECLEGHGWTRDLLFQ